MTLPVVLTPEAQADFDEAADWYEQQAQRGTAFTKAVREVFDRIAAMPRLHQVVYKDVRRAVLRRFPYTVFYRVDADRITVVSVFNNRRNPAIWKDRLQ
jgi:plasmid stabilization system protein ParE